MERSRRSGDNCSRKQASKQLYLPTCASASAKKDGERMRPKDRLVSFYHGSAVFVVHSGSSACAD